VLRPNTTNAIWLGNAILIEASRSFLGVGTQRPTPPWGLMLSSTGRAFMEQAPWLAIFQGLGMASTSSAIPCATRGTRSSAAGAERLAGYFPFSVTPS